MMAEVEDVGIREGGLEDESWAGEQDMKTIANKIMPLIRMKFEPILRVKREESWGSKVFKLVLRPDWIFYKNFIEQKVLAELIQSGAWRSGLGNSVKIELKADIKARISTHSLSVGDIDLPALTRWFKLDHIAP